MKRRLLIALLPLLALALPGATSSNSDFSANDDPYFRKDQEANESPEAQFFCPSIDNVAAFENRIHLRCSLGNGSIFYYAFATDPANVATAD